MAMSSRDLAGDLERPDEPDEPVDPEERPVPEDDRSTPEDYRVPEIDPEEPIAGPAEDDDELYAREPDEPDADVGEGEVRA